MIEAQTAPTRGAKTPSAATAGPGVTVLRRGQVADYERLGWILCPAFFSVDETSEILRWTEEVAARPELPGQQMVYREASLSRSRNAGRPADRELLPASRRLRPTDPPRPTGEAVEQLLGGPAVCSRRRSTSRCPAARASRRTRTSRPAGRAMRRCSSPRWCRSTRDAENGCLEMADARRACTRPDRAGVEAADGRADGGVRPDPVPTAPGDVLFFDSYAPHASKPNLTDEPRRILYLTYNAASDGDHRARYYADKRATFPPDIERDPDVAYRFRV